jgi:hypothetical protein
MSVFTQLKWFILLCFIFISTLSLAQESEATLRKKEKNLPAGLPAERMKAGKSGKKPPPENIEVFPRNFLVRPRFVYPLVSVNVTSRLAGKGEKFIYMPAIPGVVGLSLKIKKVYISAAIQLPVSEKLKKTYGASKFRNININIRGRILQWGLFFRDYKGFYLNNYSKFYPNWNLDSAGYPKAPGLHIVEAGLNLDFNFNKNFSLNAAFSQGERQKKSAGSFLLGITERYQGIDADTSFVPLTQGEYYPNLDKFKYGHFASTIISAGIGFQFVKYKFHFTPVLMAGTGLQIQIYETTKRRTWLNIPTYTSAKAQLGYNGDHFFANIIYATEFNSIPLRESRIRLFHKWFEVGAGVRF